MYGQRTVGLYDPIDAKQLQSQGGFMARQVGAEMSKWHERLSAEEDSRMAAAQARQAEADNMARQQHQQSMESAEFQKKMQEQQAAQQAKQANDKNDAIKRLALGFGNVGTPFGQQQNGSSTVSRQRSSFAPFRDTLFS